MAIDIQNIFVNYTPNIKSFVSNPIIVSIVITLIIVLIIVFNFDYEYNQIFKTGFWILFTSVIIIFLHDTVLKTDEKNKQRELFMSLNNSTIDHMGSLNLQDNLHTGGNGNIDTNSFAPTRFKPSRLQMPILHHRPNLS
jgi:hypothetical protein